MVLNEPAAFEGQVAFAATDAGDAPARTLDTPESTTNPYAIYWQSKKTTGDHRAWFWTVRVTRQTRVVVRSFAVKLYGDKASALLMAQAYRDALLRLLPPVTVHQKSSQLQARNSSGVSGVRRFTRLGNAYWQATFSAGQKDHWKTFSVNRHGETEAKSLAIGAREAFERGIGRDAFLNQDPNATALAGNLFAHLLSDLQAGVNDPVPTMAPAQVDHLVAELDRWFDGLRPRRVDVSLKVYDTSRGDMLCLAITDGGSPARQAVQHRVLRERPASHFLVQIWAFVQLELTAMHGAACWDEFEGRYRANFFAFEPRQGFGVRYR